jgi:CBS domain-containing protein
MAAQNVSAAAILEKTSSGERFHGIVTAADLAPVFGEHPASLLREIATAPDVAALRDVNQRVRAFLAANLATPESVDWLAKFAHHADTQIVGRVIRLADARTSSEDRTCWCFTGAAGRRESLTQSKPGLALIYEGNNAKERYEAVSAMLDQCGYIASSATDLCGPLPEWTARFQSWLQDPVQNDIFGARPFFDLLPVAGDHELFRRLRASVSASVSQSFLYLLANDCLSNLPPLTFFRDDVVSGSGEQSDVFDLQRTALEPLVDVGRVFALASGHPLGASTIERFAWAKSLLPEQERIFREASETLSAVLFHQARVGIREHTDGSQLPPALLSRHDRQVLKNGFRAILKLLEFTAECEWLVKL